MSNQAIDHKEVLQIRWAFDDPNPIAQDSINRADKDAIASLLQNKGISLDPAPFEYPSEYQLPDSKRQRTNEDGSDTDYLKLQDVLSSNPSLAYPNTDQQYTTTKASVSEKESKIWAEHVDTDSGATYYYNESTGESSWSKPE